MCLNFYKIENFLVTWSYGSRSETQLQVTKVSLLCAAFKGTLISKLDRFCIYQLLRDAV